jgi:hypothetical protein
MWYVNELVEGVEFNVDVPLLFTEQVNAVLLRRWCGNTRHHCVARIRVVWILLVSLIGWTKGGGEGGGDWS